MEIKELIKGIVVIIDDEVDSEGTDIYEIRKNLTANHFPVVTYNEIPEIEDIQALSHAAFIILDWNFSHVDENILEKSDERLMMPGLVKDNEDRLIVFLKTLRKEIFVPVFIFTTLSSESVENSLREKDLLRSDKNSDMIFVKQKNDVSSEKLDKGTGKYQSNEVYSTKGLARTMQAGDYKIPMIILEEKHEQ